MAGWGGGLGGWPMSLPRPSVPAPGALGGGSRYVQGPPPEPVPACPGGLSVLREARLSPDYRLAGYGIQLEGLWQPEGDPQMRCGVTRVPGLTFAGPVPLDAPPGS